MAVWYRIFGTSTRAPEPASLCEYLHGLAHLGSFQVDGEPESWMAVRLDVGAGEPLQVERFRSDEPGIRGELSSWAAWLETREENPHSGLLMENMISTAQLFLLRGLEDTEQAARLASFCVALCQYLARATEGIYQVDGAGLFTAEGTLLVSE